MNESTFDDAHDDVEHADTSLPTTKERKKRARKGEGSRSKNTIVTKGQTSLERFARLIQTQETTVQSTRNGDTLTTSLEEDPNGDRRKRQKTISPERSVISPDSTRPLRGDVDWLQQLQAHVEEPEDCYMTIAPILGKALEVRPHEEVQISRPAQPAFSETAAMTASNSDMIDMSSAPMAVEAQKTTPQKHIKATKNGKLVSSPPRPAFEASASPKKRRGRKSTAAKILPMVTVIKYGSALDIPSRNAFGQKIDDILTGKKRSAGRPTKAKKLSTKPVEPPKSTHPFFNGKKEVPSAKTVVEPGPPPTPRKSACTPGKLRSEIRREQSPEFPPAFGMNAQIARASNQSGLNEASWPTRETSHVRNLASFDPIKPIQHESGIRLTLKPRKMKKAIVLLPEEEELVARLARDLCRESRHALEQPVLDFEPPEDVRLPTRLLTTGTEIQRKVREQLFTRLPLRGMREEYNKAAHPAVVTLFDEIGYTLTPFDEGRCESQIWSQKYSPQSTLNVLQTGTEATILKDWLQNLTVMAVGGALKSSVLSDERKPPRKKRKKGIDDFIVSDDEDEDEDMVEVPYPGDWAMPYPKSTRLLRWTRNKNVILISGPQGCGKSATVHAVAKELDFEVFEINSGTRRSGKDIQDRVGDMTANHLVNHRRIAAPGTDDTTAAKDSDNERIESALQDDISSGRQGTMTSFFQAKSTARPKPVVKAEVPEVQPREAKVPASAAQALLPMITTARKSQKQSLIFFEEADVLFEEDQQFWAQVTKLALNSKRPVVISCNDERQIPTQDLPLAATLRLRPPPVDLATDYLLVLAGREGHILERKTVEDLYNSKRHDLRASIMELNFWCQMSVGDRKGGLEWMYQRWPPGKDVNEHGNLLRVASEMTYQSGMGWLSHNVFVTQANTAFDKEEELLQEVWQDWGISPNEWITPTASDHGQEGRKSVEPINLCALERLDDFVDSLSAADVYCRIGLPTYRHYHYEPTDPSLPAIPEKARLSYTSAAPLLQVDYHSDFSNFDTSICIQTRLQLQRAFPEFSPHSSSRTSKQIATESEYVKSIMASKDKPRQEEALSRLNFAYAMDVLAAPPDNYMPERTYYNLTPSSFDRNFSIITLDLAPYVRSIVAHEQVLELQRSRISDLLSFGGNAKRSRTTRAARTALEGGVRETKRRDRWFDNHLNFELVMATAGQGWAGMGWKNEERGFEDGICSRTGTLDGTHDSEDVSMQDSQDE